LNRKLVELFIMVERAHYEILGRIGELEVRRYPELVTAKVFGMSENVAFSLLFDYISGNNRSRAKVEMVSPVHSEVTGMRVPMTAPVVDEDGGMAFILPAGMTIESAPRPLDERVKLLKVPSRTLAVLRFKGVADQRRVDEMTGKMLGDLAKANIVIKGRPILMRYDPPFKPGFLRRNEVAVEIGG